MNGEIETIGGAKYKGHVYGYHYNYIPLDNIVRVTFFKFSG